MTAIKTVILERAKLPGSYKLPPGPKPYPLSRPELAEEPQLDAAIYDGQAAWPGFDGKLVGQHLKRGYRISNINLFPEQYTPASGEITYATRVRIEISLADTTAAQVLRPTENAKDMLLRSIDNPETLAYRQTATEYLPRITMLGEYLGFGGASDYAMGMMEQIRTGGDFDGYFTTGFTNHTHTDFIDFDTSINLYDYDYTWPASDLIDLMNSGTHLFNHLVGPS